MRALTLQQPFASAIAVGGKRDENRSRRIVGRKVQLPLWVGLHAGKTLYPGTTTIDMREAGWWQCPPLSDLPRGVMLGAMRIDVVYEYAAPPLGLTPSAWAFGPWCLRIGAVRLLDQPIECRGMLGLWPVNDGVVARALEALVP